MLYITGKKEKLRNLMTQEELINFNRLNPHLAGFKQDNDLPPHTPILFSTELPELKELASMIYRSSYEEKEKLWLMQESRIDIPTLVATEDLMSEAQRYAQKFRDFFDHPLISSPWINSDPFLTNGSLIDILGATSGATAGAIYRSRQVNIVEPLYEAICKRSALDEEIARLSLQKGKFYAKIAQLEREARFQTGVIKNLLPNKVDDKLVKFLNASGIDHRSIRNNNLSKKLARKGKPSLGFEFLNKTGLDNAKKMIQRLIKLGSYAEKAAFALGAGVVVYDTVAAYQKKEDFTRTFLKAGATFGASLYMGSLASSSAWGACAISTLAGNSAAGGLILASCPFLGTVVLVVVGLAAIGYASYKVGEWVGEAYDSNVSEKLKNEINQGILDLFYRLEAAWKKSENWIMSFYGADLRAR